VPSGFRTYPARASGDLSVAALAVPRFLPAVNVAKFVVNRSDRPAGELGDGRAVVLISPTKVAAAVALAPLLAACGNTVGAKSPPVTTRTVTTTESPTTPLPRIVPKVSNCGIQKPHRHANRLDHYLRRGNERAARIRWLTWTFTLNSGVNRCTHRYTVT
jgi:hypothetical protein